MMHLWTRKCWSLTGGGHDRSRDTGVLVRSFLTINKGLAADLTFGTGPRPPVLS